MINFSFGLSNPWCRRWANVWNRAYELPIKSKYLELEVYKDNTIVSFMFRLTTRQDHAGLMVDVGLLGYSASFQYYDIRHWNDGAGRYYIYDEENGSH
jgi:hypothetical protein